MYRACAGLLVSSPASPLLLLVPRRRRALERYQRDVIFLFVIGPGEVAELGQAQVDEGLPRGTLADRQRSPREAEHLAVGRVRFGQPVAVQQRAVTGLELETLFLVVHPGH